MLADTDVGYFQHKTRAIYDFGNDSHNHDRLLELFQYLWNFARNNRVFVNDIDFAEGRWDGPRRVIFELLWDYADDWQSVENIPISAEKYSEWTALVSFAAESMAQTISRPLREIRITRIHWISLDTFAVEFSEHDCNNT